MITMIDEAGNELEVHPNVVARFEHRGYTVKPTELVESPKEVVETLSQADGCDEPTTIADKVDAKEVETCNIETIVNAIDILDESDFTTTGKPKVESLEAVLGFDITMAQRDEAWTKYKKAQESS